MPLHSQSRTVVKLAPVFLCRPEAPTSAREQYPPVSLSNRFTALDERAADVHIMTDGSVGSTESDTISLAGEPASPLESGVGQHAREPRRQRRRRV